MIPVNPDDIVAIVPDAVQGWTVGSVLVVAASLLAVVALLMFSRRMFKPTADSFKNFIDDWNGEPERHGRDKRLGVMERLVSLEVSLSSVTDKLQDVTHELRPNSGKSLKDVVDRIETKITTPENRMRSDENFSE